MNAPAIAAALQPVIPLASISPSKTNPRKHFDKAKLQELAVSIKAHGLVQPILVRPVADGFEIVAGERRVRAAKIAGLTEIAATVRELTDAQALELQVIENNQRADLHPLEEAEGFEALLKCKHEDGRKYTVDDIVAKIGRSRSYVYQKLKLCELCYEARTAFYEGKIDFSKAILLARIAGAELQRKALEEIADEFDPMSARDAQQHILHNYTLALDRAPFPIKSAELLPKAGACTTCPKRTGNAPELFEDVKNADVCTDPACFGAKRDAHTAALAAIAKAEGREVITGKEARKIAPYGAKHSDLKGGYTSLDSEVYTGGKMKTIRQILGKDTPKKPALLEDTGTGALVEIVKTADIAPLLKTLMPSSNPRTDTYAVQQRAREAKEKIGRDLRRRIYFAAREAAGKNGLSLEDLRVIAAHTYGRLWHEYKKSVASWWLEEPVQTKGRKVDRLELLAKKIPAMNGEELIRLLLDCALVDHVQNVTGHGSSDLGLELEVLAKRHGVDTAPIKREAAAQVREKAAAKKAKKPAKKKGGRK